MTLLALLSITLGAPAAVSVPFSTGDLQEQVEASPAADQPLGDEASAGLGSDGIAGILDQMLELRLAPQCEIGLGAQQQSLEAALSAFEWDSVAAEVREHATGFVDDTERVLLLEILEQSGTSEELDLALDLTAIEPRGAWTQVLGRTVAGILAREPHSIAALERPIILADGETALALANAAVQSRSPSAVVLLAGTIGRNPEIDLPLIGLIARASEDAPRPLDPAVCEAVRNYLWVDDFQLRREAAQAAGKLGDFGSADALVEMLGSEDETMQATAHWALREMSGMDFSADRARWQLWLETEKAWFASEAESSLGQLQRDSERIQIAALETLSTHRYRRFEIASRVAPLLSSDAEDVRTKACAVLQELTPTLGHAVHTGCPMAESDEVPGTIDRDATALAGAE